MSFIYRPYRVVVGFKNEGEIYGRETYRVMASNEDMAEKRALTNATASQYDDDRLPDRRLVILECEEVEDDEDQAQAA